MAGGLLDLQAGGRLQVDIDPWEVSGAIEERYRQLWAEVTHTEEFDSDELWIVERRLERLHELGFDVGEMELVTTDDAVQRLRLQPRVVEHGYHAERLRSLTGLDTEENQARRLLNDICAFGAQLHETAGRNVPENIVAVRWLDQRFEPIIEAVPAELFSKLEPAELYHQLLEHRWFLSQECETDVSLEKALESYIADVLISAPDELLQVGEVTMELPVISSDHVDWAPQPAD